MDYLLGPVQNSTKLTTRSEDDKNHCLKVIIFFLYTYRFHERHDFLEYIAYKIEEETDGSNFCTLPG